MNDNEKPAENTDDTRSVGRRSQPEQPHGQPSWDCDRSAHHIGACPGCRGALEAIINGRVVAILNAFGQQPTTSH